MVRPLKTEHRISQMISCYERDLKFFDEHKGNMKLSTYLIEAGYNFAGDSSRYEKAILELQEAKREINQLKEQLSFEKLKNKKQNIVPSLINDAEFKNWIKEKGVTSAANWINLFAKNSEFLIPKQILNEKQLKAAYEDVIKNSKQNEPGVV